MTRPVLARAARQRADQVAEQLADATGAKSFLADVYTVTPGAASDGNALVTVSWRGQVLTVADYPDSYTPAVGHRVRCLLDADNQLAILHRGIGHP